MVDSIKIVVCWNSPTGTKNDFLAKDGLIPAFFLKAS